jgi:hypothetical protein
MIFVIVVAGILAVIFIVALAIYLWRGYRALDQWPEPHGRYYRQWIAATDVGDYYPWLAQQMGNREPWRTWAALEAALPDVTKYPNSR